MNRLLIADDEALVRDSLSSFLERKGYEVETVGSATDCIKIVQMRRFDLLFLDLSFGSDSGFEVLESIRKEIPDTFIFMLTAFDDPQTRSQAERLGADGFIGKTFDRALMHERVKMAVAEVERRIRTRLDREQLPRNEMVGQSDAMRRVFDTIRRVASADVTVLIRGETGTGKELVAQAIHRDSKRNGKPFVAVNCAAISEKLLESEIFGHVKGAFTGAEASRMGKFEAADAGTLFLDEISKGSLEFQSKMLRVLESGTFSRIGANEETSANVRLIAASNADLQVMMDEGRFLPDLYFRINVMAIDLPPLRERREDISALVEHFVHHFSLRHGQPITQIPKELLDSFCQYSYPGNVRELRNLVERAVMLSDTHELSSPFLEGERWDRTAGDLFDLPYHEAKKEFERKYIESLLARTGGNRAKAAELAGIDQATLFRKLRKISQS